MNIIQELKSLPNHVKPWSEWLDNENQYERYAEILKKYDPTHIFEIGTCLGYFLSTAIASLDRLKAIVWIDNESYSPNTNKLAEENIVYTCNKFNKKINYHYHNDYPTRKEYQYYYNNRVYTETSLVHIDGDHTEAGCLFDLNFALDLIPDIIIGHDYTLEKGVEKSVNKFCKYNNLKFTVDEKLKHGLYIIEL